MRPVAQADGHDSPGLRGEAVPGVASVIEDVALGSKDSVGEPILAQVLPDVLDRVESKVTTIASASTLTGASTADVIDRVLATLKV